MDLEVQVTFDPYDEAGNVKQAKTGILFSVKEYTIDGVTNEMVKRIDSFFDSSFDSEINLFTNSLTIS